MRNRIDYGIDLGTTNSAIARIENGSAVIKKSEFQKDTMASCISFGRKGRMQTGDGAFYQLKSDRLAALTHFKRNSNVFTEVKRTMGTDEVYSPEIAPEKKLNSDELSSEILKKLKGFIADETVHAAVITIPAEFKVPQQQATKRAGELAGFTNCQLLQEPVAAAMAFAADGKFKDGKFVVFDFGGGTFDSALVLCKDGNMTVSDTEGDNFLGGKDLDYAIVDNIILPYLRKEFAIESYLQEPEKKGMIRDAMKSYAEELKIQLSTENSFEVLSELGEIPLEDENGEELELDFEVTREELKAVISPVYQRAIDLTIKLLNRNGLKGTDLEDLVLVGGPTLSPILREMIAAQLREPNTSVDPMTAVARGAAIFASTIEIGKSVQEEQAKEAKAAGIDLLQLDAKFEATSVLDEEVVVLKPKPGKESEVNGCKVELRRVGWSSGQFDLRGTGTLLDVLLEEGKPNVFEVVVTNAQGNVIEAQPKSITILQGTRVEGSPLTNSLGIEVWNDKIKKGVFQNLKGAERGRPLPVIGIANGLKTTQELKPGDMSTLLQIRVFEGNDDAIGKSVIYCDFVHEYKLSGGEIPKLIPAGSEFDLTLKTEPTSGIPVLVQVTFVSLDLDFELEIPEGTKSDPDSDWFKREVANAKRMLRELEEEGHSGSSELQLYKTQLNDIETMRSAASDRGARDQATHRLKELLRGLEGLATQQEWPRAEAEMDDALSDLIKQNAQEGNDQTTLLVKDFERKVQAIKERKDATAALMIADEISSATHAMIPREEMLRGFIAYCYTEFDSISWTNAAAARIKVNAAAQLLIQNSTSTQELDNHAREINNLIDRSDVSTGGGGIPTI